MMPNHNHRLLPLLVVALLAAVLLIGGSVEAFCIRTEVVSVPIGREATTIAANKNHFWLARPPSAALHESSDNSNDNDNGNSDESPILSSASPNASMSKTSRLSHAALRVSSVDDSVAFWVSRGGRLVRSRSNGKTNGEAKLLSAFVQLGLIGGGKPKQEAEASDEDSASFALEILQGSLGETPNQSHGLLYLGLSMLLRFNDKNPLLELMTGKGDSSTDSSTSDETQANPDRFLVKYVASAPGDGFAQLALLSDDKLVETCDFYTTVLGMDQKAQDRNLLCLRYDCEDHPSSRKTGVTTTLIFERNQPKKITEDNSDEPSHHGCFDHLSIHTTCSIEGLYQSILEENKTTKKKNPVNVCMKPTEMFGNNVLGLLDPNGYKVVVFGSNR